MAASTFEQEVENPVAHIDGIVGFRPDDIEPTAGLDPKPLSPPGLAPSPPRLSAAERCNGTVRGVSAAAAIIGASRTVLSPGQDRRTATSDEIDNLTEDEVVNWIAGIHNSVRPFAPLFKDHKISGDLVRILNDAMLQEIGVDLVGPRARILQAIAKLKTERQRDIREKKLWTGVQIDERGCCTKLSECNCWFPRDLDLYTLTPSYLEVQRANTTKYCGVRLGLLCGQVTKTKNRLHVSQIRDVDSCEKKGCCSRGYAEVHVSTGDESRTAQEGDDWRTLGRGSRSGKHLEVIKRKNEAEGEELVSALEKAIRAYNRRSAEDV